ncbi:MAG: DUF3016 domain-containing protein [Xanthomonadaceae bacterium]|nr:DUF3016 domain-containing protein [Xanthomonadaceae bacterium]
MHIKTLVFPLALVLAVAGCASAGTTGMLSPDAPRALPAQGPVSVAWADPATFTEFKASGNRQASAEGEWLTQLAQYMRKQAAKSLPAGDRLELTIVDIQRAGRYEPWHGLDRQNVRMIRDIYPPRMTVKYRETDANGSVVAEGERKLTDPAFLVNAAPFNDTDPLRYEKRMVDSWLRHGFNRTAER